MARLGLFLGSRLRLKLRTCNDLPGGFRQFLFLEDAAYKRLCRAFGPASCLSAEIV